MRRLRYADARTSLLDRFPKEAVGAEVGVWRGDFSQRILDTAKPKRLHLIDPWRLSTAPEHADAWYGENKAPNMEATYAGVVKRFETQIADGTVSIHRGLSGDLWETFPEGHFDFVYIDGDHSYDGVRSDLFGAYARVRQGGLLCGDDYTLDGWWGDGVVRALHEFLAAHRVRIESLQGNQFVVRKL